MHLACQQNRTCARAEKRAALCGESLQRLKEAFLGHHLQMRAALAARQNDAINIGKIFGTPHERVRSAEAVKRLGVSIVVTLNRQYPDVHKPEPFAATDKH